MELKQLIGSLIDLDDATAGLQVSSLASNSSDVRAGSLFFGLPGVKVDGANFVKEAEKAGALAAVISEKSRSDGGTIPVLRHADPRFVLAKASASFFQNQPEIIAAVTGTAGKTSVATFLRQIWTNSGFAAASLGTTGVVAPGRNDYGNLTTPDPISLHRLLLELASNGVTHASMEASSHGLDQRRLDGVRLSVGGFTNLGRDHLDYHPDIEAYLDAKLRLFRALLPKGAPAVVFSDDGFSQPVIAAAANAGLEVCTVGRRGGYISLKKVEHHQFNQVLDLEHAGKFYRIEFPLAGDFQVSNALVAVGMAIVTGTPADKAFSALSKLKGASGRLELIGKTADGSPVYVDYAHKPEALENILFSLRPFTPGNIHLVFGCGGDRDKGKRPIMGEIACKNADRVIVTDDNPRTEDPAKIRSDILVACKDAVEIGDREEAILFACSQLQEGDCLVIAGKGHEPGQIVGNAVLPFSDHEVAKQALRDMNV